MARNFRFQALLIAIILACVAGASASCPTGQAKDENTLLQQEESWAKALDEHDAMTIGCLLADEFRMPMSTEHCTIGRKRSLTYRRLDAVLTICQR